MSQPSGEWKGQITAQQLVELRRDAFDRAMGLRSSSDVTNVDTVLTSAKKIAEFLQNG